MKIQNKPKMIYFNEDQIEKIENLREESGMTFGAFVKYNLFKNIKLEEIRERL